MTLFAFILCVLLQKSVRFSSLEMGSCGVVEVVRRGVIVVVSFGALFVAGVFFFLLFFVWFSGDSWLFMCLCFAASPLVGGC